VTAGNLVATTDADLVNIASITLNGTGQTLTLTNQTEGFTINGSSGNDTITGGAGDDVITGGTGADTITTGTGSDTVVLAAGSMGAVGVNTSADTITDFAQATDTIQFSITGQTGSLVSNGKNVAVAAGAAVVQHIADSTATTLGETTNVVVLDGTFTSVAAMITAIGGSSGSTKLTEAASFTANSDLVVVWTDGTNSHVSLVNDANSGSDAAMLDTDLTATEVVTLSGVTSVAAYTAANFSFIA
jgi:Ca2+-binding RTX toxin-like protein